MTLGFLLLLLCIITIVFFVFVRKKNRKGETISFISTTLATLIGVLLAVMLSDLQNQKNDKLDTIKILRSGKKTLELNYEYSKGMINYNKKSLDTLRYKYYETTDTLATLSIQDELPYPDLYENIIQNELVTKNISEFSLFQIYNVLINLRKLNMGKTYDIYLVELKKLIAITEIEIQFQQGEINEGKLGSILSEKMETFNKELLSLKKVD